MMFYTFWKLVVVLGKPIAIPFDATDDDLEEERQNVENMMAQLEKEADRYSYQK